MEKLLEIRESILEAYLNGERFFKPLGKFLAALAVMLTINTRLGYNTQLKSWPVTVGLSVIAAFVPVTLFVLLTAVVVIGHIFSEALVIGAAVSAVFLVIYLLLLRFTPKYVWAVVAIPVLSLCKLQFMIPILLGLTGGPVSILAVAGGVAVSYVLETVRDFIQMNGMVTTDYMNLYQSFVKALVENKDMISTILIFAVIVLVVYIIRTRPVDYGFELSIVIGTMAGLFGFLIAGLADGELLSVVAGSLGSGLVVLVIWYFFLILDYTETENLQFQDDEYYYYVRAVPKVKIQKKKKRVKKINEEM